MAIDDKFDGLQRLVELGKEKGYVLYDEVSEVLPSDLPAGGELEEVLAGLDGAGIEILEEPKDFEKKAEEAEELLDLELPAGVGEKVNDPVRMYLREMGTVPLLTREGEVEIARRIERGQNTVLKSLSRAPLVILEILGMGEQMARNQLSARDVIQTGDPLLADDAVEEKQREFIACAEEIGRHYRRVLQCRQKLHAIPRGMKPKQYRRQLWELGRQMVRTARIVRDAEIPEPGDPAADRAAAGGSGGTQAGRARDLAGAEAVGDVAGSGSERAGRKGSAQGTAAHCTSICSSSRRISAHRPRSCGGRSRLSRRRTGKRSARKRS